MYLGSWQSEHCDTPQKFIEYSKAFIAGSMLLCDKLIENPTESLYEKGCVVMYNAYHAIELFLKGAILYRSPRADLHHMIEVLAKEYERLYPDNKYHWNIPFCVEVLGYDPAEAEIGKKKMLKEIPQDQVFRYPVNKNKENWDGLFAFEPKSFSVLLKQVEADFERLEKLIFKG